MVFWKENSSRALNLFEKTRILWQLVTKCFESSEFSVCDVLQLKHIWYITENANNLKFNWVKFVQRVTSLEDFMDAFLSMEMIEIRWIWCIYLNVVEYHNVNQYIPLHWHSWERNYIQPELMRDEYLIIPK